MADKPERKYIATSGSFPGYWGAGKDGPRHAIANCLDAGADRGCVFVVYEAYDGCYIDEMGGTVYLVEHGNPFEQPEGVYDATGEWLGQNLAEVAKECAEDRWGSWVPEHSLLSKETIASLKRHHKQEAA